MKIKEEHTTYQE